MDYEKLLKKGLSKVPKGDHSGERFEIPETRAQKDGARTIITNFFDVAKALRRDPEHLLKFLVKELATSCDSKDSKKVVVLGNFSGIQIDKKIELYVEQYVTCPECGKPDTKLTKEDRLLFMICEACGARHSIGK